MNKKQNTGNIIKRLFFIGMKFKTRFIWALIVSVILASVSVYRPIFTQHIVDTDIIKLKQMEVLRVKIWIIYPINSFKSESDLLKIRIF